MEGTRTGYLPGAVGAVIVRLLLPGGGGRELLGAEQADAGGQQDVVQPRALQEPPQRGAVVDPRT